MAEMRISNTLVNDTSTGEIAYVDQVKDRILKKYIAENPDYTATDKGRIPSDIKAEIGVFQERLNEFFLDHWVAFQRFMLDEGVDPSIIDSWYEVKRFLEGLDDDTARWLKTKLESLDTAIASIDQDGIGTFDISAYNNIEGTYATYANLDTALSAVPIASRKSGMTIRYIDSSANEYKQYRYMLQYSDTTSGNNDFVDTDNWTQGGVFSTGESVDNIGIDDEPTAGSDNLVKSGGVAEKISQVNQEVSTLDTFLGAGEYSPITLGNYYILDGVVTALSYQTCKYFKVIKGQRFGLNFTGSLTLRYGFFSDVPEEGDTATSYGSSVSNIPLLVAPSNGYFAFSYGNALQSLVITPYSKIENIEDKIIAEDGKINSLSEGVVQNTASIAKIDDSIVPYITIQGAYIPDGKVTELGSQNTYYHFLKKGTKVKIEITVSTGTTLRWGVFAEVPVINAQALVYGSQGTESHLTFNYTMPQDGFFAASIATTPLITFSFETKGLIEELATAVTTIAPQVAENTLKIGNLIQAVGEGKQPIVMQDGYWILGSLNVGDTYNPTGPQPGAYKCSKVDCQYGDKFTLNATSGNTAGLYCFTDADNKVLVKMGGGTTTDFMLTAPTNAAHLYINDNSNSTSYIGEEDNITKLQKEVEDVKALGHFNGLSSTFSLAASASKTLGEVFVRKNSRVSLNIGTFTSFRFGLGYNLYQGYWIEVDSTTVSVYNYVSSATLVTSYSHGLDVSLGINATIVSGEKTASIILTDAVGTVSKTDNINWWGGGAAFITNLGNTTIEGTIAYFPGDITKKIWMFGDSYFSYNQTARWLYYMVNYGFTNWLANHLPGINSDNSIPSFDNLAKLGKPQFIVWCLGMNDGSDTDASTPQSHWLADIEKIIGYCNENAIVPILATIPSVPNIYHEGKNNYVRNSGYRYIDFAKAVNAQSDGTWTTGLLSGDNVHPTVAGAKVLASQVLVDFSEIMEN